MRITGACVPVSFAAITFNRNVSAAARLTSSLEMSFVNNRSKETKDFKSQGRE